MKTALKIICVLAVLLVLALGAIFVLLGGPQSLRYRRHFDSLVKTNNHDAVARAAITVMRGTTNQTLLMGYVLTNLPPEIAGMNPKYVSISPEHMTMEFHGGFDHFGFKIQDRDKSWEMSWYTEKGRHPLLSIGKGEPNGTANGSQPIRSETNTTSATAGSRR